MYINESSAAESMSRTAGNITFALPGLIRLETRNLIENVISCGFLPAMFLLGLAGNLMTLTVLAYQGTKETTNIILIGLTVTDLTYINLWSIPKLECIVRRFAPVTAHNMVMVNQSRLWMPTFLLGRASGWFICLVAVERFIAVLFPLKASSIITRSRVIVASVLIYVCVFASGFHLFFLFDSQEEFSSKFNTTVMKVTYSKFASDNFHILVHIIDPLLAFVLRYVPLTTVLLCTVAILRALQRSLTRRQQMSVKEDWKHDTEQRRITKTLLSICILFIVCSVPGVLHQIARSAFTDEGYTDMGRYRNISAVVVSLSRLFDLVNSSVNFVLYIITSRRFAATWRTLFLCSAIRKHSNTRRPVREGRGEGSTGGSGHVGETVSAT